MGWVVTEATVLRRSPPHLRHRPSIGRRPGEVPPGQWNQRRARPPITSPGCGPIDPRHSARAVSHNNQTPGRSIDIRDPPPGPPTSRRAVRRDAARSRLLLGPRRRLDRPRAARAGRNGGDGGLLRRRSGRAAVGSGAWAAERGRGAAGNCRFYEFELPAPHLGQRLETPNPTHEHAPTWPRQSPLPR